MASNHLGNMEMDRIIELVAKLDKLDDLSELSKLFA
jgi:hypothetical protein